ARATARTDGGATVHRTHGSISRYAARARPAVSRASVRLDAGPLVVSARGAEEPNQCREQQPVTEDRRAHGYSSNDPRAIGSEWRSARIRFLRPHTSVGRSAV